MTAAELGSCGNGSIALRPMKPDQVLSPRKISETELSVKMA